MSTLINLFPDVPETNARYLTAFELSADTPTEAAAPAVMSPTVIHFVSVPSDEKICPLVPNPPSPSRTCAANFTLPLNVVIPEISTLSKFV